MARTDTDGDDLSKHSVFRADVSRKLVKDYETNDSRGNATGRRINIGHFKDPGTKLFQLVNNVPQFLHTGQGSSGRISIHSEAKLQASSGQSRANRFSRLRFSALPVQLKLPVMIHLASMTANLS